MRGSDERSLTGLAILLSLTLCAACAGSEPTRDATPGGARVYVSNEMAGTVSVVDPVARRVVSTITVGKRPRGIRASRDGRTVYVALSGSPIGGPGVDESALPPPERQHDGIGVIDAASGRLIRVLQGGTDPEQFALSADGRLMFIANEDAGQTTVLEVESGAIVKTIPVGGEPEGVDISPDGRFVYVTAEADNQVFVIDTGSLEVVEVIDVGPRPRSTGFVPNAARAYVSAENEPAVYAIDTSTHAVLQKIALAPPALKPMGIVAAPDGRHVFATMGRGRTLVKIDTASNALVGSIDVGERPWGLAISPDGGMIVTANGPSNDVSIVDTASWQMVGTVPVGERPWGVVFVRR